MATKQDIEQIKQLMVEKGDATAPKKNTEGVTDDELENENAEGEIDEGEEGEAAAAGAEGDEGSDDGEGGEGEQGASGAVEGEEDATVTPGDLAELIGWEAGDVYDGLIVPLDDGQEPIPLGQLKNQFQDQRRELETVQQQLEQAQAGSQEQVAQAQGMQQMSQQMMQLVGYAQSLDRMEQGTDWAELEAINPTEAVLKRQKLNDARMQTQQQMRQLQQRENGIKQQMLQAAAVETVKRIPTWKDEAVKKADQDIMRGHMRERGFSDIEINHISDPRIMHMVKEYADMKKQIEDAQKAVKRVRKAPALVRNAAGRFQKQDPAAATKQYVDKAKKTGKRQDELNAAKAIFASRKK